MPLDRPRPLTEQIHDRLAADITAGRYRNGDQIPSVTELAAQYEVSRTTAARALQWLAAEGIAQSAVPPPRLRGQAGPDRHQPAATARPRRAAHRRADRRPVGHPGRRAPLHPAAAGPGTGPDGWPDPGDPPRTGPLRPPGDPVHAAGGVVPAPVRRPGPGADAARSGPGRGNADRAAHGPAGGAGPAGEGGPPDQGRRPGRTLPAAAAGRACPGRGVDMVRPGPGAGVRRIRAARRQGHRERMGSLSPLRRRRPVGRGRAARR